MADQTYEQLMAQLDEEIARTKHIPTRNQLIARKGEIQKQYQQQSTVNQMGELSSQLLDPTSKFYQQYASYLQKATPGIGTNTLLAPLMAGGSGYAGGQAIASQKATGFARERQDSINKGVQGFAMGNINVGANLLGNQGNLQLGYANLAEQQRQYNDQNSGWNQFFGMLGSGAGLLSGGLLGGGGASSPSGVNGYGYSGNSAPANPHRDIRRLICQKIY